MKNGTLTKLDNTRVLTAHGTGINAKAIIRNYNDPLSSKMIGRFATPKDGVPSTWVEAV